MPSLILSDHGSQFVGSWWKTLCALLGIRHAVSQAYHHRANGRAERAGQQLFERLKRIQIEAKICWVEAMPQVLDRLHDTPVEGGLSPYQILFGIERQLAYIPYKPPRECEDYVAFFSRMKEIDKVEAEKLNTKHKKENFCSIRTVCNPQPSPWVILFGI